MSSGKIAKIKQAVLEQVERDDLEGAWRLSQPLLKAGRVNHDAHRNVEHRVVTGKLCAPPDVAPSVLLEQLDRLVAAEAGAVQLLVPELAREVGDEARAGHD
jgi:hypothetical protein